MSLGPHDHLFHFRTECPKCRNVSEIAVDTLTPTVSCGDCLMERVEVVPLKLTRLKMKEKIL